MYFAISLHTLCDLPRFLERMMCTIITLDQMHPVDTKMLFLNTCLSQHKRVFDESISQLTMHELRKN